MDYGGRRPRTCRSGRLPGQNRLQLKDKADEKQHKAHREEDHSLWVGTLKCDSVQVPWSFSQSRGLKDLSPTPSKSSADNSSTGKTETHVKRLKHKSLFQVEATACTGPTNLSLCMQDMDKTEDLQRKIQAVEMRCSRRIHGISYTEHITYEEVCAPITKHM